MRRGPKGRLTDQDVAEIRSSKEKGVYLAIKYGVCHQAISKIRTGKLYRHLPGAVEGRVDRFTAADIVQMRLARTYGATYRELGESFGCSEPMAQAICARLTYKWVD